MKGFYGLGLISALAMSMPLFEAPIIALPQSPSNGVKNLHRKIGRSRYQPHQGKRECARRIRQGLCPR